ncbi:hypothetical protein FRB93_008144 [Tulasnella sp. JGI-2019a]|nr:hypothetical protein FRB93_008144 [Tulasnella sp. JGI-2019a]
MSHRIKASFESVQDAIDRSPPSGLIVPVILWNILHDSVMSQSPEDAGSPNKWRTLWASGVVPRILRLFETVVDRDNTGISCSWVVEFTNQCTQTARFTASVPQLNQSERTAADTFLQNITNATHGLVERWWRRFRHLTPGWVRDGRAMANIGGFIVFFQVFGAHELTGRTESYSADIHDFLLFSGTFLDVRGTTEAGFRGVVFALHLAVIMGDKQPHRLPGLMTIRINLESKPLALAEQFQALLSRDGIEPIFSIITTCISWFMRDGQFFFHPFLTQKSLARAILSSYWSAFAKSPQDPNKNRTTLITLRLISQFSDPESLTGSAKDQAYLSSLLSEGDLLCLVQKMMILLCSTHIVSLGVAAYLWDPLWPLLLHSLDALRPPLTRDFLFILDYLRGIDTEKSREFLEIWLELGSAAGISEDELRNEDSREREALQGDLIGCGWIKCPWYEQEFVKDTFLCAGCQKVAYCELSCQERDWKEGDHQAKCKR